VDVHRVQKGRDEEWDVKEGISDEVKRYVLFRDEWRCRHCRTSWGLDPHHVIFRSAGGPDTPNNLLTLCRKCHDDVHGGRLKIEIVTVVEYDLIVKFWKQKGWKP
jgi:5-methylcytosine-specific restriction endonuclease McrA